MSSSIAAVVEGHLATLPVPEVLALESIELPMPQSEVGEAAATLAAFLCASPAHSALRKRKE